MIIFVIDLIVEKIINIYIHNNNKDYFISLFCWSMTI